MSASEVQASGADSDLELGAAASERTRTALPPIVGLQSALDANAQSRLRSSLAQRLTRSVDGLPRHSLPVEGEAVDVRGRFQHVVVQVRDAQGQLHTECLENQSQVGRALGNGAHK